MTSVSCESMGTTTAPMFHGTGDAFPSAREFKAIMCSSGNEKGLQTMIKAQLTTIAQSIKQEVLYSVGEECTCISSGTSLVSQSV